MIVSGLSTVQILDCLSVFPGNKILGDDNPVVHVYRRLSSWFQFALSRNFHVDNAMVNFKIRIQNFLDGQSNHLVKLDPVGRVTGLPVD